MYDLDFQRRFDRVATYVSWITTVALAATLSFDQYGSSHPLRRHWEYVLFMGICGAIAVAYGAQWVYARRSGGAGTLVLSVRLAWAQLFVSTAAITAFCGAVGGITRPYWL